MKTSIIKQNKLRKPFILFTVIFIAAGVFVYGSRPGTAQSKHEKQSKQSSAEGWFSVGTDAYKKGDFEGRKDVLIKILLILAIILYNIEKF